MANTLTTAQSLQAAHDFLDRDATYVGNTIHLTFETHSHAVKSLGDVRDMLRRALAAEAPTAQDVRPIIQHALEIADDAIATGSKDVGDWIDDVGDIAMYLRSALATQPPTVG